MMLTFIATIAFYHDDWRPVQAKVLATRIESSREGTLTWSLKADIRYEFNGAPHEKSNLKILHKRQKYETAEQQTHWPAGRTFTLYVNSDDPHSISMVPDGGREALAVTLSMLTPAFIAAVAFPCILFVQPRRRRKNSISEN